MKKFCRWMLFVLLCVFCYVSAAGGQRVQADSVGKGAKIVVYEEPERGRFHIGKRVGVTDRITAVPTSDATLTDVKFTSSNTAVCELTKRNGYWEAKRVKEGTSVITMTCKADGKEVKRTLLISALTVLGTGGDVIRGKIRKGVTVYFGASDVKEISSADTEVKAKLTADKEVLVKYQCNNFYRVELEDETFGDSDEEWGFVKKEQVEIPVTGITARKEISIFEKQTASLDVKIMPTLATNGAVTYRSSNNNVATIDSNGKVTGIHAGTAVITVTSVANAKYSAKCRVTVKPYIPVTGIRITPPEIAVDDGTTGAFQVEVLPANASIREYSWKIADDAILRMDSQGKYHALKPGQTTATVMTKEGGFTDSCQITVRPVAVKGISMQKEMSIDVGEIASPLCRILPANATNKGIRWSSSDTSVVNVDKQGRITGLRTGKAKIQAKTEDGGFLAYCDVTVEIYVEDINLDETILNLTLGKSRQMKPAITPQNPTKKKLIWMSKNKSIVSVTQKGKVKALRTGTAEVIVYDRYAGAYDSCLIDVAADLKKPSLSVKKKKKKYALSWKKVARATDYFIYQYQKKEKKFKKIKALGKKKTRFKIPKAAKGSRYKLRAYYKPNREYSSYSKEVKIK